VIGTWWFLLGGDGGAEVGSDSKSTGRGGKSPSIVKKILGRRPISWKGIKYTNEKAGKRKNETFAE